MTALTNSDRGYGAVTKAFHWLTALLILAMIPLGLVAQNLAHAIETGARAADQATIKRAMLLFSIHKTVGVALFFVALARIGWAVSQPKPGLINGDRPIEAFAASTVHWLLYGSLLLVPLSGWVHHAATTGFAPIWWPFGQSLPFVPKDEAWADTASTLHNLFLYVLAGALVLHIAGALKHHLIDDDATLRRMLPGAAQGVATARQPGHVAPLLAALVIWLGVLGSAAAAGWFPLIIRPEAPVTSLSAEGGNWLVEEGSLGIVIVQSGAEVTGSFSDWSAQIQYAETSDEAGKHGEVMVDIHTGTLALGSVTSQAIGSGFLESEAHPLAQFRAEILRRDGGLWAIGDLTIRENAVPVEMPFTLSIAGDTAEARGSVTVDRRDFSIGMDVNDESSLRFDVDIRFDLVAERRE